MKSFRCYVLVLVLVSSSFVFADSVTVSPLGISSAQLNLNGQGIAIGQIEFGRPAVPNFDTDPLYLPAASIAPEAVFERAQNAIPNQSMTDHAMFVASILISTDPARPSVSPEADLYSSAFFTNQSGSAEMSVIDATNKLVALDIDLPDPLQLNSIRAINHSYVFDPTADYPNYQRDGTTQVSLFMDWSARQLRRTPCFWIGVDETSASNGTASVPNDSFNGISVSASERLITSGQNANEASFRKVSGFTKPSDLFNRSNVDLIAPGKAVGLTSFDEDHFTGDGTSFATPHVTGTIALLQQYGDAQVAANAPNWGNTFASRPTARRHEVMKAVLLNSADKIKDIGDGFRLGMTRDVEKKNGDTWLDSDAFTDVGIALDEEIGAGHLNAARALYQFGQGEHDATVGTGTVVPQVGWDYSNTNDTGAYWNEYEFEKPLPANSYVSITVAWDRRVDFDNDGGTTGEYDLLDTFEEVGFNDVNIYLLPKGSSSTDDAVGQSITSFDNTEHLFFQIPTSGEYEFWVYEFDDFVHLNGTDYAVAWWAFDGPIVIAGDFDGDGIINQGDYVAWRDSFGQTVTPGSGADGNNNGIIDAADYTVWRDAFSAVSVSVPEPSSLVLFLLLAITCGLSARAGRSAA